MTDKTPKISVIMPVYNTAKYLHEAIDSILNQTFKDFEFIIIDDCSTDGSNCILKNYTDNRIILLRNEINKGIVYSLNLGIELSKGEYLARMDSDDISAKNRLFVQYSFLEKNSDISVLSSDFQFIDSKKNYSLPHLHNDIKVKLLNSNPICHPSVMIRREFLVKNQLRYDNADFPAEDYGLWIKMALLGAKFGNVSSVLLFYREHPTQITRKNNRSQLRKQFELQKFYYQSLFADFNKEVICKNFVTKSGQSIRDYYLFKRNLIANLYLMNKIHNHFENKAWQIHIIQLKLSFQYEIIEKLIISNYSNSVFLVFSDFWFIKEVGFLRYIKIIIKKLVIRF